MALLQYEDLRKKNLEENKRFLAEIGLLYREVDRKATKRKSNADDAGRRKRMCPMVAHDAEGGISCGSVLGVRRMSARLRGKAPGVECFDDADGFLENRQWAKFVMPDRPTNWYGGVPGIAMGTTWELRVNCCRDGVHRPTVAGIHSGPDGAFSLALSGGYEDDIDLGECFTYTGEGGRDLKGTRNNPKNLRTAPQSRDQQLVRGNLAMYRSVQTGNPVRVIRGYKLRSRFAPEHGYRYDGLYTVERWWLTKGLAGYNVFKYALHRCPDQAEPPWHPVCSETASFQSSDSGLAASSVESDQMSDG